MNCEYHTTMAADICRNLQEIAGCIGVALLDSEGKILERTGRIAEWFIEKMNRIVATRGEVIPSGAITVFHSPPEIAVLVVESEYVVIAEYRSSITFGTMQKELESRFSKYVVR